METATKRECDINGLMRRAEHEICYSAKRAIEMYYDLWKQGAEYSLPEANLFSLCANRHGLNHGQIEACRKLMQEFGME